MNLTATIVRGELLFLKSNKGTLYTVVLFVIGWSLLSLVKVLKLQGRELELFVNNEIFILANTLCIFILYTLSTQAFVSEKKENNIETILCTPVTLRKLWLGKTLGILVPTYVTSLTVTGIIVAGTALIKNQFIMPSEPLLFHVVITAPILYAAVTGLLGFVQLLVGMNENRILSLAIMGPVLSILMLASTTDTAEKTSFVDWNLTGAIAAGSLALLALTMYLAKYLSKERIVTTLS